jgi:hypothetical protein
MRLSNLKTGKLIGIYHDMYEENGEIIRGRRQSDIESEVEREIITLPIVISVHVAHRSICQNLGHFSQWNGRCSGKVWEIILGK